MPATTHGFCVELSLSCPSCRNPVPVNGLTESLPCPTCHDAVPLGLESWKDFFDAENVLQVLTLDRGLGMEWSMLGSHEMQGRLNHLPARCGKCKAEVPVSEIPALADLGRHTCTCGQERTVRVAPGWARAVFPGARWVVDEHLGGLDDGTRGAVKPVLFACMGCGGSLHVDGSERVVRCSYCGDENFLPDALWMRLRPVAKIREFFVVAELSEERFARLTSLDEENDDQARELLRGAELPPELLAHMSNSRNEELRVGAAVCPGLPPEAMERLARDEEYNVRAALAGNPALSPAIFAALAEDDDDDVRSAVASLASALPAVLARLLADSDWDVRRVAMRNPRTPLAAIAARASEEHDSDVLCALGERDDLDTTVLEALANNTDSEARVIAAGHPDTPPEALTAMVEGSSRDVWKLLAGHPATPPEALARLIDRGWDDVAMVLAERSDLPRALLRSLAASEVAEVAAAARANPAWAPLHTSQVRNRLLIAAVVLMLLMGVGGAVILLGGLSLFLG